MNLTVGFFYTKTIYREKKANLLTSNYVITCPPKGYRKVKQGMDIRNLNLLNNL